MNARTREVIRKMRLYAQRGAKSLAPFLDAPRPRTRRQVEDRLHECLQLANGATPDGRAICLIAEIHMMPWKHALDVHAAYQTAWRINDAGEPEVVRG